jgi:hypothetical protein
MLFLGVPFEHYGVYLNQYLILLAVHVKATLVHYITVEAVVVNYLITNLIV